MESTPISGPDSLAAGQFADAVVAFEKALAGSPEDPSLWHDLGLARYKARDLAGARVALERCLALAPEHSKARLNLARTELEAGNLERARELCQSRPSDPAARVLLGHLHEVSGETEQAAGEFLAALELDGGFVGAWCGLARLKRIEDPTPLARRLEKGALCRQDEAALRMALAQAYDRLGAYDEAFSEAARGNALRRIRFDPKRYSALVDRVVTMPLLGVDSPCEAQPIFIVGAPRSGSSLLQRILGCHPALRGLGELPFATQLAQGLGFPALDPGLDSSDLAVLAESYLAALPEGEGRPIDKAPSNLPLVGLLARIFPRATFLHIRRDPRDVAVSNFLIDFGDYRVGSSTSIRRQAAFLEGVQRLGAHWKACEGLRFHELSYEELVEDLEGTTRRLLRYLDLDWDEACLGFHQSGEACFTASSQQVTQPLNRRGIGRWKNYARYLEPLLKPNEDSADRPRGVPMKHPSHSSTRANATPLALIRRAEKLAEEGAVERAVEILAQVIGSQRGLAPAWSALGHVLEPVGRWVEAARAYEEAVRLSSQDAQAHKNLGRALVKCGRIPEALRSFRRAVTLAPDSAECHDLLALAQHATGHPADAARSYRRAVELDPRYAPAHHHLGLLLGERGERDEALTHLELATRLRPEQPTYQRELARAALRVGDVRRARAAATEAVRLSPEDAVAHVVMGWTYEMAGAAPAARASYSRALELDPAQASPYYKLARWGDFDDLEVIDRELERPGRNAVERSELEFARAEILAARGEHEAAWRSYAAGNAEVATQADYDAGAHRAFTRRIIEATPPRLFEERAGMGDPNRQPIFVVGMPRSGTSLVSQILAAHPLVHDLGEHDGLRELASHLRSRVYPPRDYPEGLAGLERMQAVRMAGHYLASFERPPGEYERVVDKAPGNYHFLGLLALILPRARVIHVRRDPLDTCVSNWTTNFGPSRCTYSLDLEDLAAFHEDYQDLMEHWRRVCPLSMLEVDYEDLVSHPEQAMRELIAFAGLPWDEACLRFHESDRDVLTASSLQVREPLHSRSVGRWRIYEPWLGPLARLRRD